MAIEVGKYKQLARELARTLAQLEWREEPTMSGERMRFCPACPGIRKPNEHKPGCVLAAMLDRPDVRALLSGEQGASDGAEEIIVGPNEFIWQEIAARGWTLGELCRRSKVSVTAILSVLNENAPITEVIAAGLARAFGTSAALWLNLDAAYRAEWEVSK